MTNLVPQGVVGTDDLAINCVLVRQILVGFVRSELNRAGFHRAVFGLSGGVDSSVIAYLLAEALGPDHVLAVRMPYKTSSQATKDDALLVVQQLGLETLEISITDQIDAYFRQVPESTKLRLANKCARERMSILYDQSADFGGLVVGTNNKTELLLGYGTQFGCMAHAINPVGDLYKTQLRQLGRHLGVPEQIMSKVPTADLWAGQTDEEELGFTYEDADQLLYLMVDRRWQKEELIRAGFDEAFVLAVGEKIRRNQYKRRLPVIAKLSHRTVDSDFRYARDWGT